jgi:DnaJ-class molecular chaperone
MAHRRDYYRILGVSQDADPSLIKAAYYTQLKTNKKHPDLGGSHEEATLLNEAYEVLSDPIKRKEYDRKLPKNPYTPQKEQRRVERTPFFENFKWRPQKTKEWFEAQFRDISPLGACFRSLISFKKGDVIELDCNKNERAQSLATVRWVRKLPQRFGPPLHEGGFEFGKVSDS